MSPERTSQQTILFALVPATIRCCLSSSGLNLAQKAIFLFVNREIMSPVSTSHILIYLKASRQVIDNRTRSRVDTHLARFRIYWFITDEKAGREINKTHTFLCYQSTMHKRVLTRAFEVWIPHFQVQRIKDTAICSAKISSGRWAQIRGKLFPPTMNLLKN